MYRVCVGYVSGMYRECIGTYEEQGGEKGRGICETKIRYATLATKIIKNQENILFRLEECARRIGNPKQKKIGENGKGKTEK